ncbi:interleukin-12 receptor subunit beta-2-like isoform X2 [Narcine bancroftii]|uniref:interleukin-12 receptor subunit beta-2-like isoform X2 n=1 Tax=Narcine bancroftii TaxID=1343680 RepID=UPI00383164A1
MGLSSLIKTVTAMMLCIKSNYPPDQPSDLKCIWKHNNMQCTWNVGNQTFLSTQYALHVQSMTTGEEQRFSAESKTNIVTVLGQYLKEVFKYKVWVQASNALGNATSKDLTFELADIVIPDTPKIIKVEFINNSASKMIIYWKKSTARSNFEVKYRIKSDPGISWTLIAKNDIIGNSSYLNNCEPFREYEFQIRCSHVRGNKYWSRWSKSFIIKTPEAEPMGVVDAWSLCEPIDPNKHRRIIIYWKPLRHPQETRGIILGYHIYYQQNGQNKTIHLCKASDTRYSWRKPREAGTIFVTAFNSKGNSTPAVLHIGEAKLMAPRRVKAAPAGDSGIFVEWEPPDETSELVLGYVVYWIEAADSNKELLGWKRLPRGNHSLFIGQTSSSQAFLIGENIMPRKRYNISVTAIYQKGRGKSCLTQGYSVEGKPTTGPNISLMKVDGNQVQIKWKEIPLERQQGFITSYTIYVERGTDGSSLVLYNVTDVAVRTYWLTLELDTIYTIHMTATTAAGEGEKGAEIPIKLDFHGIALPLQLSLGISIPSAFLLALTLTKSVRHRIKTTCNMLLPGWVHEEFPNVENSTVAKGLEKKDEFPFLYSPIHPMYNDPPITEVQEVSLLNNNKNSIQDLHEINKLTNQQIDCGDFEGQILDTPVVQNSNQCQINEEAENIGYKPQSSICRVPTLSHHGDQSIQNNEDSQVKEYKGFNNPAFHKIHDISTNGNMNIDLSSGHLRVQDNLKYLLRKEEVHFVFNEHHRMYVNDRVFEEQTLLPDELVDCLLQLEENSTDIKNYFPQIVAIQ